MKIDNFEIVYTTIEGGLKAVVKDSSGKSEFFMATSKTAKYDWLKQELDIHIKEYINKCKI